VTGVSKEAPPTPQPLSAADAANPKAYHQWVGDAGRQYRGKPAIPDYYRVNPELISQAFGLLNPVEAAHQNGMMSPTKTR
jgi:hypothetical protein